MNMLATARRLLADTNSPNMFDAGSPTRIDEKPNPRFFVVTDELRKPSEVDAADIATNIANAARENTMSNERPTSVSEALTVQMGEYAGRIRGQIATIRDEQKTADEVHSDAIAALKAEIQHREEAHSELTKANNERIADHEKALAGIEALQTTINPPPKNLAPTYKGPKRVVRENSGEIIPGSGDNPTSDDLRLRNG